MNYIQAMKLLENGELNGIYVLSGEEIFLIDKFVELFQEKIIQKDFFDMNYAEYDFAKIDLQKLKLDCETAPFFSNKRLIIVNNVNLSKSGVSTYKTFFEDMYDYINKIPKTTVLLLVMKGSVAFRGKFYKEISILGHNIELTQFNEIELFKFIKKRFVSKNIEVKDIVLKYIIDRIGYLDSSREKNLYDVENEVKKLTDSFSKGILDFKDVDEILIDKFENSIFKLLDMISKKDYKNSIKILIELKKSGEDSFSTFYMIVRYIRNLLGVKVLKSKQKHIDYISKELKISNYECKKLYSVCDNFSVETLCNYIHLAYSVEADIKTKSRDMDLLLEILISKMSLGGAFVEQKS